MSRMAVRRSTISCGATDGAPNRLRCAKLGNGSTSKPMPAAENPSDIDVSQLGTRRPLRRELSAVVTHTSSLTMRNLSTRTTEAGAVARGESSPAAVLSANGPADG